MAKDLRSIVRKITDLPTLPQVVTVILALIDNPDSSAEDVNRVMEKDPALVGKILKLVNSAYYGLPNKINAVRQAIVILGFSTVKSLAISASVFDMFDETKASDFNREDFWAHSIGCAAVGRLVGRREPGVDEETAFVVSLLHDLGKMVLDQYAPDEFAEILTLAKERGGAFWEVEGEVLDTNHAEIGAWLAERWGLSEELRNGIQFHHRVAEAPEGIGQVLASVAAFADYIVLQKGVGASGNYGKPELDREAWARLSLKRDDLPKFIETVTQELEKTDVFFSAAGIG